MSKCKGIFQAKWPPFYRLSELPNEIPSPGPAMRQCLHFTFNCPSTEIATHHVLCLLHPAGQYLTPITMYNPPTHPTPPTGNNPLEHVEVRPKQKEMHATGASEI